MDPAGNHRHLGVRLGRVAGRQGKQPIEDFFVTVGPRRGFARSSRPVMAARPSLPGGSSCEPTLNQMRKEIVGSPATGSKTEGIAES